VDIAGRKQLEAEILAHEARCVLVSHDRFFARAIGTRFPHIEDAKIVEESLPGRFGYDINRNKI
jgi:ATPase subunit of ABC transporter with duplicated ATPase domains